MTSVLQVLAGCLESKHPHLEQFLNAKETDFDTYLLR